MHRHVRRLRLACTREEHARHGRVLLEDALRTASFGDEGRLVLVRRLNLGRVPLRANATQWSRRLEESYERVRPIAVAFGHPAAGRAAAVYFAANYEPWIELARRTIASEPCTEWFWRPALPGWQRGASAEETLRLCFHELATLGGLRLTLLLAARVPEILSVTRSLREEDVATLRQELGRAADAPPGKAERKELPILPELNPAEATLVRQWGARDLRVRWLAAARLVRFELTRAFPRVAPGIMPAQIDAVVRQWRETPRAAAHEVPARAPTRSPPANERRDHPLAAEKDIADRFETRAGGVFFAVPLLVRAGLPEFLAALPADSARAWPWHWFELLLRHGRIAADDPMFAALALTSENRPPPQLGRWLLATNRLALRSAQLSLRGLVNRPARVSVSATHVDVFFRNNEADVRVRRAGLDVDPGWVPWLGRVIAYHFNRED